MDLPSAIRSQAAFFPGRCSGVKRRNKLGGQVLPTAAIRGEATCNDYQRPEVPALSPLQLQRAAIFAVALANRIPCGAPLRVSDQPMIPEALNTQDSDRMITAQFVEALKMVRRNGRRVKRLYSETDVKTEPVA